MKIYIDWKSLVLAILAGQEVKFVCAAQNLVEAGEKLAQILEAKVVLELAPEDQRREVVLPPQVLGKSYDNAFWDCRQMHGKMGGVCFGDSKPGFSELPPVLDYVADEPGGPDLSEIAKRLDFRFLFPNYYGFVLADLGHNPYQNAFWDPKGLRLGSGGDILPSDIIGSDVWPGRALRKAEPFPVAELELIGVSLVLAAASNGGLLLAALREPSAFHQPTDVICTTERAIIDVLLQVGDCGATIVCGNQQLVNFGEQHARSQGMSTLKFELAPEDQRIAEPPSYRCPSAE